MTEEEFISLYKSWYEDTWFLSDPVKIINNYFYQKIVSEGISVFKFLLNEELMSKLGFHPMFFTGFIANQLGEDPPDWDNHYNYYNKKVLWWKGLKH